MKDKLTILFSCVLLITHAINANAIVKEDSQQGKTLNFTEASAYVSGAEFSYSFEPLNEMFAVTFNVDMSQHLLFNPEEHQVWLSGSNAQFDGGIGDNPQWPQPGTYEGFLLADDDGDLIYSITIDGVAPNDYEYKYFWTNIGTPSWDNGYPAENESFSIVDQDVVLNDEWVYAVDYLVSFNITNQELNPIQNAHIFIDAQELVTNNEGFASLRLQDGEFEYQISAYGYLPVSETLIVSGDNLNVDVVLTETTQQYSVTFNVDMSQNSVFDPAAQQVWFSGSLSDETEGIGGHEIWPTPGTYPDFQMSDDDGDLVYTITINNVVPGEYSYKYFWTFNGGQGWNYGYPDQNASFTVLDQDVVINEEWVEDEMYFVTFHVSDEQSNPIEGAMVDILWYSLQTNAEGNAVTAIDTGTYEYTVSAEGYDPYTGSVVVVDQDLTESVTLMPSTTQYSVTFNVDMSQNSMFNPEEQFLWLSGGAPGEEGGIGGYDRWPQPGTYDEFLMTDEDGDMIYSLTLYGVEPGDYDYKYFWTYPEEPSWDHGYPDENASFTVVDQDVEIDDQWITEDVYAVSFYINDEDENSISGAIITISDFEINTDMAGYAEINLTDGSYDYSVSAEGYIPVNGSVEVAGSSVVETVTMYLGSGGYSVTFNVDMSQNSMFNPEEQFLWLSGGASGEEGGIGGYDRWPQPGTYDEFLMTDEDGDMIYSLTLYGVEPGDYEYKYFWTYPEEPSWNFGYPDENVLFSVIDQDVELNDEWVTEDSYSVSFYVNDAENNPISEAIVSIGGYEVSSDIDGYATVNLEDGTYEYNVYADGYLPANGTVEVDGADVEETVTLSMSSGTYTVTFNVDMSQNSMFDPEIDLLWLSGGAAGEEGSIGDHDRWPMPGTYADFRLLDADGDMIYTLELSGVLPGDYEYKYFITEPGAPSWDVGYPDQNASFSVLDQNVVISDAWTTGSLYNVSFYIIDEDTDPIQNATVNISGNTLTTDVNGYTEVGLENGMYEYTVYADGYLPANGTVEVDGADVEETVTLSVSSGTYTVTFNVDMSQNSMFNPEENLLWLSGSNAQFNGGIGDHPQWPEPGTYEGFLLNDEDGDMVYSITIENVVPNDYEYKYFWTFPEEPSWDHGFPVENASFSVIDENVEVNDAWVTGDLFIVSFNIQDEDENPISEATVSISGNDLITNEDGHAEVSLVDGVYDYAVSADGFIPVNSSVEVAGSDVTETVTMSPSTGGYSVTFNVDMTGVSTFDPEEQLLWISGGAAGDEGSIGNYERWPQPGTYDEFLMTDEDGDMIYTLTLTGVEPGDYEYKYFWTYPEEPSWDHGFPDENMSFTVVDEDVIIDDGWFYDGNTLTFNVVDEEDNPVAGAFIDINGHLLTTNDEGVAEIDLSNGIYNYFVSATGYVPYADEVVITDEDITELVALAVATESYTVVFNIDMSQNTEFNPADQQVWFSGAAVGETSGIGGHDVWPQPGTYNDFMMTDDDEDMIYTITIDDVMPGAYEYKFFWTYNEVPSWDYGYPVANIPFTIVDGDAEFNHVWYMGDIGILNFICTNATGGLVNDATIEIGGQTATTDEFGLASVLLEFGTYEYVVTASEYGSITGEVVVDEVEQTVNIQFVGIADAQLIDLNVYPNPSTGVFNITMDGKYQVKIISSLGRVIETHFIDEKGEINLNDYAPGVYLLGVETDKGMISRRIIVE